MGGLESIRFFPDVKGANLPFVGHKHVHFGSEQYHGLISELQAAGAGAFFSVNRTDGVGASAENIVAVRTYYVDVDGLKDKGPTLEKMITARLKPSAIVETKNGVHAYWYARDGVPVDYGMYRRVQKGLIKAFGGDKSVQDIARVLRIPGTLHQKNPEDPFTVRIVHQLPKSITPYYSADEVLWHYPYAEPSYSMPAVKVAKNPKAWGLFLEDLGKWDPVPGERNTVMLLSAGVAISYGVSMEEYEHTLYAIAKDWGTGRDVRSELRRVARWAYGKGTQIPAATLRKRGVPIRRGI